MSSNKGEIKGWITRNGKHIPIYENYTAQPSPQFKNAKIKANRENAINPSTIKDINDVEEVVMGKDAYASSYFNDTDYKEAMDKVKNSFNDYEKLGEEIRELNTQLEKESRIPTAEELPGFSKDEREMFAELTPKGKEIKERIKSLREEQNNCTKVRDIYSRTMERMDEEEYRHQKENFKGTFMVPTDKTDFKGFQLDTGTSYYEELREKGQAHVVEMTPKEYLQRCAYQVFDTTLERTVRAVDPKAVREYAVQMNNGTDFYMPVLNLADKEQEGRHRAVTAIVNGIKTIPVLVVPPKRR